MPYFGKINSLRHNLIAGRISKLLTKDEEDLLDYLQLWVSKRVPGVTGQMARHLVAMRADSNARYEKIKNILDGVEA